MRERVRQASNLNGCRMIGVEAQQCSSGGRGRVKDRSARRVSPKNAIGIGAPQPHRRRSERMHRQSRVTENCKLRSRVRHHAVATITANKDLIGPPVMCVHASAGAIQRQSPIALTHEVPGRRACGAGLHRVKPARDGRSQCWPDRDQRWGPPRGRPFMAICAVQYFLLQRIKNESIRPPRSVRQLFCVRRPADLQQ